MLQFDEPTHTYTLDGIRLPSVTQVLDTLGAYIGIPADVLAKAADRGDAVHYATELHDRGELDADSVPDAISGYFSAYLKFLEETGFAPSTIEDRVFSKKHRFAGTLDRTGTFTHLKGIRQSKTCLLDIKCTAKLMPTTGPQTAAYAAALLECSRVAVHHRFALQLKPDGTYTLKEHHNPSDLSVFLSALSIMNWKLQNAA